MFPFDPVGSALIRAEMKAAGAMVEREIFVKTTAAVESSEVPGFDVEFLEPCLGGGKRGDCAVSFCYRQVLDSDRAATAVLLRIETYEAVEYTPVVVPACCL